MPNQTPPIPNSSSFFIFSPSNRWFGDVIVPVSHCETIWLAIVIYHYIIYLFDVAVPQNSIIYYKICTSVVLMWVPKFKVNEMTGYSCFPIGLVLDSCIRFLKHGYWNPFSLLEIRNTYPAIVLETVIISLENCMRLVCFSFISFV